MITKLNSDEVNITNVNQSPVVEKVLPAKAVSTKQALHENDNNVPSSAAVSDRQSNQSKDATRLNEAVRGLNEHVQIINRELHFSIDKDSGRTLIKVIDLATKEVIRQIPSKEALAVARMLQEGAGLKLFNKYT